LIFKKLFATEENKDLLMSLINAILPENEQIVSIILKNPYQSSDYAKGRLSILDIKAEGQNGTLYDIEMQMRYFDFFPKRTLYYWSKMFGSQLDNTNVPYEKEYDKDYIFRKLRKCIVISLMNFSYFRNDKIHTRCFTIKDKKTNKKHKSLDYLDLHFVELPKFKTDLSIMETVQSIENDWLNFLKTAWNEKGELQVIPNESPLVAKAREKLRVMALSQEERVYYEGQQKVILDHNAAVHYVERSKRKLVKMQEKIEQREAAIIQKELEMLDKLKQIEDRTLDLAKKLLKIGENNETIKNITKFSEDEIEKLRKEMQ
jgi:predicted transposase/invertase (TIGR01784 family)